MQCCSDLLRRCEKAGGVGISKHTELCISGMMPALGITLELSELGRLWSVDLRT